MVFVFFVRGDLAVFGMVIVIFGFRFWGVVFTEFLVVFRLGLFCFSCRRWENLGLGEVAF